MVELNKLNSCVSVDSQKEASLTKHIRLMIYGFLPTWVVLTNISTLSKVERQNLIGSNLASANREVEFSSYDPIKHYYLLKIVDIAGFCLTIDEDHKGHDLAE